MNNQNNINTALEYIVIDALKGAPIDSCKWKLHELAELHQKNPLELFSQTDYTHNTSGLMNILKVLAPNEAEDIKDKFLNDCQSLKIPPHLINFLEFLTHQGYHRFHPHINTIKKLKPIRHSYGMYSLGAFCLFIGVSAGVGIFHVEIWNQMLCLFIQNGSEILRFILRYIFIAENIAFITLLYRLIDFVSKCYKIYSNYATTADHKFNKMLKIFLVDSLIISAQALLYANKGLINPISGYLFIASSFVELAYSALSLYQLTKPIQPIFNKNDSQELQRAKQAHFFEENAYYQRTFGRCFHELWAFAFIAGGTVIAIAFSNHLLMIGITMVIFQFMVSQIKDYVIFQNNKAIDQNLQKQLRTLYPQHFFNLSHVESIETSRPRAKTI